MRGLLSPRERHLLRSENGAWDDRSRENRGTAFCVSRMTVCEAGVGRDWGHTPIWTGYERGVFTPELVFVTDKSIKLPLRQEESKIEAALPCEWPAREGESSCMSGPRVLVPSYHGKYLSVGR